MDCRYSNCKSGCVSKCKAENSYHPSNGTEGMSFMEDFCGQCIHDHPDPEKNPKCDILTATMCFYPTEPEYPKEWIYRDGMPFCTKFKKWDWGNDGDPDDPDNPKAPVPYNPNQLEIFPLSPNELNFQTNEQRVLHRH